MTCNPFIHHNRNKYQNHIGFGCTIGTHFYGAVAYADDVLIMSPSVQGLQEMVNICQQHAEDNSLVFSTDLDPRKSKTMCLAFNCDTRDNLASIQLCLRKYE